MTEGELIRSSHRDISRILNLPREEGCFTLKADDPLELIAVMHGDDLAVAPDDHMRAIWLERRGDELFIWRVEYPGNIAGNPCSWAIWCTRGSEMEVSGLRYLQREYRERHVS